MDYHDHPAVSYHDLIMLSDPATYYQRKVLGRRRPQEDYEQFGQAMHALTLEGEAGLWRDFVAVPEHLLTKSGRVSTSKEAEAWKERQERPYLGPAEVRKINAIANSVHEHELAHTLLIDGAAEVARFWMDTETGIDCKAKVDYLLPKAVVDLKGCRDLDTFPEEARRYGYPQQLAWYRHAYGVEHAYLIAVEKESDLHRVGVWHLTDDLIAEAHIRNRQLLQTLARCRETDTYLSPYQFARELDLATEYSTDHA